MLEKKKNELKVVCGCRYLCIALIELLVLTLLAAFLCLSWHNLTMNGKTQLDRTTFGWCLVFTVPKQLLLSTTGCKVAFWEIMPGLIINFNCRFFFFLVLPITKVAVTLRTICILPALSPCPLCWVFNETLVWNLNEKKNALINEETNYCCLCFDNTLHIHVDTVFHQITVRTKSPQNTGTCYYYYTSL